MNESVSKLDTSTERGEEHACDLRPRIARRENLEGQIALVTGGGRGYGRHVAQELGRAGAVVVVTGRSSETLEETAHSIVDAGGKALPLICDVTNLDAVRETVAKVHKNYSSVDILVNNAGESGPIANAWETDVSDWWRTLETNLLGSFQYMHAILPRMVDRRAGTIVNIASNAGVYRWPLCSAYSVSKSALTKLTENVAAECKRYGISIFAYHPGLLPIGLTAAAQPGAHDPKSPAAKVAEWFHAQKVSGNVVDVQQSLDVLVKLVAGSYRTLSGCYITVHDDLDTLRSRMEKPGLRSELYRLRVSA